MRRKDILLWVLVSGAIMMGAVRGAPRKVNPAETIQLQQPVPESKGGVMALQLDGTGDRELVVTGKGHVGAYFLSGEPLWVRQVPIKLVSIDAHPPDHHPSAIGGDLDGDGRLELAFLDTANKVRILDAETGELENKLNAPGEPRAILVANLRGKGDRDIILQYSQTRLAAIRADTGATLWETGKYRGIAHSPARQADLDGDGRDEVAGAAIIDHDGTKMNDWDLGGVYRHMDSMVIADIVPGGPLEVALAEQHGAGSRTDVVNPNRIVFRALNPWNWEDPDKLAVGDFVPGRKGLEIFNRSSGGDGTAKRGDEPPYANEEAPWVLDARGKLVSKYYVNDHKPDWWTPHGLEEICRIDWDGDRTHEIVAKERHRGGAGAVVNPVTGEFKVILPGEAARIYAADVMDDFREEAVLLDKAGTLKVFACQDPAPRERDSYWKQQHYRRQKQNWNYYSP